MSKIKLIANTVFLNISRYCFDKSISSASCLVFALASATKSREAMQSALKYGVETVGDLLRAQQLEYKAKRMLAKAKYQYITNRMRFMKAIGTINDENLQEINGWLVK